MIVYGVMVIADRS